MDKSDSESCPLRDPPLPVCGLRRMHEKHTQSERGYSSDTFHFFKIAALVLKSKNLSLRRFGLALSTLVLESTLVLLKSTSSTISTKGGRDPLCPETC